MPSNLGPASWEGWRNLDAQCRSSVAWHQTRWGGLLSWVVHLTLHAGRPGHHTGTRAAQRNHRLPAPPWLCLMSRVPGPRSADLAWCSRLSAPAENILPAARRPPAPKALSRTSESRHMMGHVTKLRAYVRASASLPLPRSGCVTWENLERERPTSGATSRGRTLLAKNRLPLRVRWAGRRPRAYELQCGSRFWASSGVFVHVTVSYGTLQQCFLEPGALGPGRAPFDPGTASGRFGTWKED